MSNLHPYSQLYVHRLEGSAKIIIIRFEGGYVAALDASNGFTLWTRYIGDVKVGRYSKLGSSGGPLIVDDTVCIGSSDRGLYALDIAHGKIRWRYNAGTPVVRRPYYYDGIVYVLAWNGGHAVDMLTGERRWYWQSKDPSWFGFPVNGCVYGAEAGKRVIAMDSLSGQKIWETDCAPNRWPPAFYGQHFYFGTFQKQVVRLDISSRQLIKVFPPSDESTDNYNPVDQPIVAGNQIYIFADDWQLYVSDLKDGSILWSKEYCVPSVVRGIVYTPAEDEAGLLLLDPATGEKLDFIETNDQLVSAPAIWGSIAYSAGLNFFTAVNLKTKKVKWYRRYPEEEEIELFDIG